MSMHHASTQADRAGQAEEFARLYEASSLRRENDSRLEQVQHPWHSKLTVDRFTC